MSIFVSGAPPPSADKPCREHHFVRGWGRCKYCQMQSRYYHEVLNTLNSWLSEEKNTDEWRNKMDSMKCKPHYHPKEK